MLEKIKQFRLGIVVFILVLVATGLIIHTLSAEKLAPNLVEGSGRMDGDLINLNAKYPGRIVSLNVEEGQKIHKGDIIAVLKSDEYEAQKRQIEAQIAAKETELNIAQKSIPESLRQSADSLQIRKHQHEELEKSILSQEKAVEQDKRDLERIKNLYEQHLIEKHQIELADLKYQTALNTLSALRQKRSQTLLSIHVAKSDQIKAEAQQETLVAMRQGINALKASLYQMDAVLNEMTLRSSVEGVVIEKISHVGEVIGAGSVVATLLDPSSLYLKIFVDTKENGKLHVGNEAVIFLDALPDTPIPATVVRIEQRAEFTPKEVSVPSDRIQRVFALHVKPKEPQKTLKMGIPAVGVVSMDAKGLPTRLKNVPE
jgi:HlyD family secretion protein